MVSVQLQYNYCQVTVAMVLLLSLSFYLYTLLGASVKKTDGTLSRTIVHLRCYVSFFLLFCRCSVLVFILLNEINKKSKIKKTENHRCKAEVKLQITLLIRN